MNLKRNWGRKMARNSNDLRKAKKNKNDEFYTQLSDIEKELKYYKDFFAGKTVFCNCDDPYESNFFKYFALNFNRLKLKKLIATSYVGSPVVGDELGLFEDQGKEYKINNKKAYKVVMSELKDVTGDGRKDLNDVKEIIRHRIRYLKGDGDFRSDESVDILKESDIVCTNPPFSLFRPYLSQLVEYNKKFLIIGNINCLTYQEVFSLIQYNKAWLGHGMGRWISGFIVPQNYELYGTEARIENGKRIVSTNNCLWLTNIDYPERHEKMDLFKEYSEEEFPTYDNYDAIEVSKTVNIPINYDGIMGVPITFLDKYNPEQFEIVGNEYSLGIEKGRAYLNGKRMYSRVFIRRKQ